MPLCWIAAVAVEKTLPRFDRLFEYAVPPQLSLSPGCRCTVPFGAGNEARAGVVLSLHEGEGEGLTEVLSVQDAAPLLDRRALLAAAWLHDATLCLWYDAVRQFLPPGLSSVGAYQGRDGQQWIRLSDRYDPQMPLTEKQRRYYRKRQRCKYHDGGVNPCKAGDELFCRGLVYRGPFKH